MAESDEILEVIDKDDRVIGLETRSKIHKEGLLHREIHVWFITPFSEVIFQHRSKAKDTNPDKLAPTVGGLVDRGMSYEETAVKECKEEVGVDINPKHLVFRAKIANSSFDPVTGTKNNVIRTIYAYYFSGKLSDLKIEPGEGEGFEQWKIESLLHLSDQEKTRFVPFAISDQVLSILKSGNELFQK